MYLVTDPQFFCLLLYKYKNSNLYIAPNPWFFSLILYNSLQFFPHSISIKTSSNLYCAKPMIFLPHSIWFFLLNLYFGNQPILGEVIDFVSDTQSYCAYVPSSNGIFPMESRTYGSESQPIMSETIFNHVKPLTRSVRTQTM